MSLGSWIFKIFFFSPFLLAVVIDLLLGLLPLLLSTGITFYNISAQAYAEIEILSDLRL